MVIQFESYRLTFDGQTQSGSVSDLGNGARLAVVKRVKCGKIVFLMDSPLPSKIIAYFTDVLSLHHNKKAV